ncbi:unnamed protein product [Rhizoctonia solani]|uniref:Uncharacterized protein n=1 Tax=Rhizoctonia solani TaxID=456999 RepID=A0A8H3DB80_9AGAM|nr:unnamed protein product [Rhizoctonia solani]
MSSEHEFDPALEQTLNRILGTVDPNEDIPDHVLEQLSAALGSDVGGEPIKWSHASAVLSTGQLKLAEILVPQPKGMFKADGPEPYHIPIPGVLALHGSLQYQTVYLSQMISHRLVILTVAPGMGGRQSSIVCLSECFY